MVQNEKWQTMGGKRKQGEKQKQTLTGRERKGLLPRRDISVNSAVSKAAEIKSTSVHRNYIQIHI